MKKIALLFTIVCAGQLFGMEPEYGSYKGFDNLLPEVKELLITYLHTYDNLDNIIYAIKSASLTNKELNRIVNVMHGDQKGFTALVHMLADKFGLKTAEVALKFKTPASKSYLALGYFLLSSVNLPDEVTRLIKQGADVNFNGIDTPLNAAIGHSATTVVKSLLNAGANLTPEALNKAKSIAEFYNWGSLGERALAIKKILEEAIEKKQMENQ